MKHSSTLNIFRMVHVTFMVFLIGEATYRWSGISYFMTFREFLPNLAILILVFTTLATFITVVLKVVEVLVKSITKRLGISIDFGMVYAWCFLVVIPVIMVKFFKLWIDSFIHVPYWNIFRLLIFILILSGVSAFAWRLRKRFTALVIERLTPVFWFFIFVSVISTLVVVYHSLQTRGQDVPNPVQVSKAVSSRPNIILVTMDALSARDMSVYGYERKTTPFMEEFARESHLFNRFYSNSNFTTPSVVSMLTSRYPWSHQIYHLNGTIHKDILSKNLVRVLRENGYTTMAFVANPAADPLRLGIGRDFDIVISAYKLRTPHQISTFIGLMVSKVLGYRFRISSIWLRFYIGRIFSWHDTEANEFPMWLVFDSFFDHFSEIHQPFFAWIHVMPPHIPYLPPKPYKNTFASEAEMSSERAQRDFPGPYPASKQRDIDSLRKRYDEFILYCDAEFQGFVERLKKEGLYDNSLLIFSSDHGEIFEKGYFEHRGPYLYEPLVHIPMIIHEPGQTKGTHVDTLSEQIDIAPTLMDYVGLLVPEWMEGESFLPAIREGALLRRPKFTMWFEKNRSLNHPITTGTVAVFEGDYKLIHYIKDGRSELYNLRLDPMENNNLIEVETLVAERLELMILEHIRHANATRKG